MKGKLLSSTVLLVSLAQGCRCDRETPPSDENAVPTRPTARPSASAPKKSTPDSIDLETHLREARRGGKYVPASNQELEDYSDWLRETASAGWSDRLPAADPPRGFVARLAASGSLWVLGEHPASRRGSGIVVLRPSASRDILIEAPHSFFEPETLNLAVVAFDALRAKALLLNTVHRGGDGNTESRRKAARSGDSPSDVAHNEKTHFAQAHRALLAVAPGLLTIQLHGFRDSRAPGAKVILSPASTRADVAPVADRLRRLLGDEAVRTYPDQVKILGGTTNVEAKLSRTSEAPFWHIELAYDFRRQLQDDPNLSRRFVEALSEGEVE